MANTVTVYIAKTLSDPNEIVVNGISIPPIDTSKPDNGYVKVADISPTLPTTQCNGKTVDYVEGQFVDGVLFTASGNEEYLSFQNGDQFISYKGQ